MTQPASKPANRARLHERRLIIGAPLVLVLALALPAQATEADGSPSADEAYEECEGLIDINCTHEVYCHNGMCWSALCGIWVAGTCAIGAD